MRKLVFTVGAELRGDDGVGPYLAGLMTEKPIDGWDVIDGGAVPEDWVMKIIGEKPERVVLVDAAQMCLEPGAIRVVQRDQVCTDFLLTTHALPLTFILDELEKSIDTIDFVGIQPEDTSFYAPLSDVVREAAHELYRCLEGGGDLTLYR